MKSRKRPPITPFYKDDQDKELLHGPMENIPDMQGELGRCGIKIVRKWGFERPTRVWCTHPYFDLETTEYTVIERGTRGCVSATILTGVSPNGSWTVSIEYNYSQGGGGGHPWVSSGGGWLSERRVIERGFEVLIATFEKSLKLHPNMKSVQAEVRWALERIRAEREKFQAGQLTLF